MVLGHTLHIVPDEIRGDGAAMVQFFRDHEVDIADGVPSQLKILLEAGLLSKNDRKLTAFLTGGEALDQETWQIIRSDPDTTFFNMYGPTECTVEASITRIRDAGERPNIGKAIANSHFYVLNENLQLAPIGVPGELYISGANVARGYLNRPDLTAQVFLPNPFSEEPGARMYRTGDLVRLNADGNVEFLGRVDFQVKLRGFRIELGEIESVLRTHPQIKDAVVLMQQESPANKYLTAYVIPQGDNDIDRAEIRAFLKQHLPEYMVPTAYVTMESFPLTPSGKIHRKRFPKPQESDLGLSEKIAPRTPVEELLASLWKDILNVSEVGANDNFFDLGGHSLMATQLVSRVRDAFEIELPLRDIFESPMLSDLALRIEQLRLKDPALKQPPLEPVPRDGDLPLSFSQQRLWFLDQLAPGTANYNVPTTIRLTGRLDLDVLQRSMAEIVHRHESLRTTFEERDGEPVQIIHDSFPAEIPVIDLTDLPQDQRLDKAKEIAAKDAATPFDLAKGPLFRVQLIKLDETDHLALLNLHHTITDGWSMGVLIREIAALYNALIEDKPSPLPALPVQYADYAVWQRNWLRGEVLEKQIAFWKEYIGENPPVLELPTDHPRPAVQTFNGRSVRWELPKELSRQVLDFSQKQGATLFMTLLAAFQSLMHRYSGQDRILVGSPIANRTRTETEHMIGFFVNTLVFKADFTQAEDFKSLLRQVRENTLKVYAHQDLPFEQIVEAIQPERDMSHSPLFQVAFILQNAPFERLQLKDLTIEPFMADNPTAKYDLTLYTSETDEGITCFWEYNTDLFEEATIRRMMEHYQNLLTALVSDPERKIAQADFLTAEEKQKLFHDWNQTRRDFPDQATVHGLFETLVQSQGDRLAAQYKQETLSYEQLNQRANQLAHHLLEKGLEPDDIVGISLPRSLDVPVAILAILKAGGAFLAIDPTYPRDRIAYMIQDSGLKVVITNQSLAESLPFGDVPLVLVDADREAIDNQPETNPDVAVTADNLSYVIYTSGSTGKPKGTMLIHRGLCNLSRAQQKAFDIQPDSRILQFASLSFDASVWETVMALLNGAALILTDQETLVTGQGLLSVLKEQKVTTVTLPPSVLAVMPEDALPELKTIITAGEKCTRDLVQRWGRERQFVNAYGPTETTVCASMYHTQPDLPIDPPIGKPIDNFQLYVVDANWQPVPIGVPGELCIAGVGLARGYLNRPDLTADRFVPNPFSEQPGARMYRSGDLVRWLPDGNIDFLGRIDHQVKVRGFRIELGEIEAVLTNHEKIRDAVVLLRQDAPGEQRLVAYYVTEDEQPLVANALKNYLKQELPDYMIPAAFVHLKAMPLTPNGKVDRKALPAPEFSRSDLENEYVAPRNESEQKLTDIVAELLNIEKVGVYDNFFDLGGHSLLATKFMSRIRDQFNVELPLRILFEKPTVAELAEAIEQSKAQPAAERIERVEREETKLDDMLAELENLSDEDVRRLLEDEENSQEP
ncbi:MAG TPA: amino acid adenylation domain-containing protein, partial [Caldithrix abyssi]|nr:amino acid adenylation domain-containing protein [Caldithrix abyssi]